MPTCLAVSRQPQPIYLGTGDGIQTDFPIGRTVSGTPMVTKVGLVMQPGAGNDYYIYNNNTVRFYAAPPNGQWVWIWC